MEAEVGVGAGGNAEPLAEELAAPERAGLVRWPAWLTVEVALYGGVLALAAGLRLLALGEAVLSPAEARLAYAAWQASRGEAAELVLGPLLVYGSGLTFFLFGANDLLARLPSALAGLWVVAWPYFVRREVGRRTALFTSLLLATSPALVAAARTATGEAVALGLLLLATLGWLRFRTSSKGAYLALAGGAAGLLLACGAAGYALLAPVLLAAGAVALVAPAVRLLLVAPSAVQRRLVAWAALAALAVATGLLGRSEGLQEGIIEAAASWVGGLFAGEPARPWYFYSGALVVYETAALVLALPGALWVGRRSAWVGFSFAWAALALALYSLGVSKPAGWLAFVTFPLTLAAGYAASELWARAWQRLSGLELGLFLAGTLPAVGLGLIVLGYFSLPAPRISRVVLFAPPALFVLAISLWTHWFGVRRAAYATGILGLLLLSAWSIHGSSGLAFPDHAERPELLAESPVAPDLRNLVDEVEAHSAVLATPGRRDLSVLVDERLRYPLVWYLRRYSQLTVGATAPSPLAAIVLPDRQPPPGSYRYRTYVWRVAAPLTVAGPERLWRWLMYREPPAGVLREEVRLYVAAPNRG